MTREQQELATENLNLARARSLAHTAQHGIEYHTLESVAFEGLCKAATATIPTAPSRDGQEHEVQLPGCAYHPWRATALGA